MTRNPETPRYEIRAGRLHVNGERQTVSEGSVLAGAALHRAEAKDPVEWEIAGSVEIPEELGRLILALEARKAVCELSLALGPLLVA